MIPVAFARRLALALALGVLSGAVFLGAGGRVAMRMFALATTGAEGFTLGGTLSVVLAGAIAGAIGGILFAVTERVLPERPWWRGGVFAALCYVIATPGFRPPRPLVFALFAPTFLGYGLLLSLSWERAVRRRRATRA